VRTLRAFFLGRFSYSRYLGGARPGRTTLEDFLLTNRAGHCEYFASATDLLLRQAGIPARYTVGYAAHEWSAIERRWLVRSRDAHAWAMAWIDGAWVEVDTTPPEWMPIERGTDSMWQSASDLWEWGLFLISNISTAAYASVNKGDWAMAAIFLGNGVGCIAIIAVAAWQRAKYRQRTTSPVSPNFSCISRKIARARTVIE